MEIRPLTRKSHQNPSFLLLFTMRELKIDHIFQEKIRFSKTYFFFGCQKSYEVHVCAISRPAKQPVTGNERAQNYQILIFEVN